MADNNRLWVLGAPDPEMSAIETILMESGENITYAIIDGGDGRFRRVNPGEAYSSSVTINGALEESLCSGLQVELIECNLPGCVRQGGEVRRYDHHRQGDRGHGKPPDEFLEASSLGQVVLRLHGLRLLPWPIASQGILGAGVPTDRFVEAGGWMLTDGLNEYQIPPELVVVAAADHCLAAAYAGRCPGVDRKLLEAVRVQQLCAPAPGRGRRTEEEVRDSLDLAGRVLADYDLPSVMIGGKVVRDLRGLTPPVDLPEAACMDGLAYLATPPSREGERRKVVLGGCGAGTVPGTSPVEAFLGGWATSQGLCNPYGDPARGFAGAYLP